MSKHIIDGLLMAEYSNNFYLCFFIVIQGNWILDPRINFEENPFIHILQLSLVKGHFICIASCYETKLSLHRSKYTRLQFTDNHGYVVSTAIWLGLLIGH